MIESVFRQIKNNRGFKNHPRDFVSELLLKIIGLLSGIFRAAGSAVERKHGAEE
ncbi:hypothetical protein ABES58_32780 [Paenibacillus lautus]|uniref:hypothetical protein n=1 Tax=Paenibacillus lautus TaxID=1401 RepID=UPI003D2C1247